ncbi:hypothetical protein M408DRAFT_249771 [Serendipita vermifera MAFF 305830]|uniref:Uncharacterized protein n=1 Tax=Serendipita vermifera MAFF 305830 TaxID=933852 RepID=A0A0C2WBF4_SERVB|nr:hypothetical protein M408DRAFT_249771 [Serendipita vermifera MAFF 305830]
MGRLTESGFGMPPAIIGRPQRHPHRHHTRFVVTTSYTTRWALGAIGHHRRADNPRKLSGRARLQNLGNILREPPALQSSNIRTLHSIYGQ